MGYALERSCGSRYGRKAEIGEISGDKTRDGGQGLGRMYCRTTRGTSGRILLAHGHECWCDLGETVAGE